MKRPVELPPQVSHVRNIALAAGLVASALSAIGGYFLPADFFAAWLVGWLFFLGISLGCLGLELLHNLTGGGWGRAIRRVVEAGTAPLTLLAILFLPLLLGLSHVYSWARPEIVASDLLLQKKHAYLNPTMFMARAAIYFGLWILLAVFLSAITSGRDAAGEPARRRRLALLSGPGLILWVLAITFSSVDWVMSLEPHWYSSMFGVLFLAGDAVSGLAFAIIAVALLRTVWPWTEWLNESRLHDLGNLLLAFVMFWAYVSLSQFLIIWSGNLPEETPWYLHRSQGGWNVIVWLLAGLHFLLPFLVLLSRDTKRDPRRLLAVAGLLLVMRFIDLTWFVMPSFSPEGFRVSWLNFVTPVAIGGLWLGMVLWRLPARAELPVFEMVEPEEVPDDAAHATA